MSWCVEAKSSFGWSRVSPKFATQGEAEYALPRYENMVSRAIRVAPIMEGEK